MSTSSGTLLKQRRLSDSKNCVELEEELLKLNKDASKYKKQPKLSAWSLLTNLSSYLIPNFVTKLIWFVMTHMTFFSILAFAIFWCSTLIYITFYYNFIPTLSYKKSVNFDFDSRCNQSCLNPSAFIDLRDLSTPRLFSRGQSYKFFVNLNLPESDINWSQGVFMVRLYLLNAKGKVLSSGFKSAILKYKSLPIRLINVLAFWPFYVLNFMEESQSLSIELIPDYIDNLNYVGEAFAAKVVIEARNIQIYDSELLITATLSGLRYYMIYWPVTSAVVGISIVFFFLSLLSVLTFYKLIFNINDETDDELTEELLKETYKDETYKDEGFSYSEADTMNNLD